MSNNRVVKPIVFILGAGFNIDAASEAGYQKPLPVSERPARYPLVSDLLTICFNLEKLPYNIKSIEELFQECINRGEIEPLNNLYDFLMELDYYVIYESITPHLELGGKHYNNAYIRFLRDFKKSPLITFNYDSLPEILLFAMGTWFPNDGYGVPVEVQKRPLRRKIPEEKSLRHILHLHGSLCVHNKILWPENGMESEFLFDAEKLGNCFSSFLRGNAGSFIPIKDRVIAPIPNKAEGLKGEFIKAVYDQAVQCLINANQIVVIGYSFNPYDYDSYDRLLVAMPDKPVLLVAPDAGTLKERLSHEYSNIRWTVQSMSFKEWVNNGYPGVRK
jgi:hypothetical protein